MMMTDELRAKLCAACEYVVDSDATPEAISNLWSVMMEMPVAVGSLAAVDLSAPPTIGVLL